MNWESWLLPKNSWIAPATGLALTISCSIIVSESWATCVLWWYVPFEPAQFEIGFQFATLDPPVSRWSMSSIIRFSSSFNSNRYLIPYKMSSWVRVRWSRDNQTKFLVDFETTHWKGYSVPIERNSEASSLLLPGSEDPRFHLFIDLNHGCSGLLTLSILSVSKTGANILGLMLKAPLLPPDAQSVSSAGPN